MLCACTVAHRWRLVSLALFLKCAVHIGAHSVRIGNCECAYAVLGGAVYVGWGAVEPVSAPCFFGCVLNCVAVI